MDVVHWALDLREPQTIEAEGPEVNPESTPAWLKVKYHYAARQSNGGDQPPVNLTWYNGGGDNLPALVQSGEVPKWGKIIFVGKDGLLATDYRQHKLLPQEKFKDFTPPTPTIPKSIGHHLEWITACKSGGAATTTCNFDYSGALAETVQLGNVAYRTGQKLTWDAANLKAIGCPAADQFIGREYRKGWEI